MNLIRWLLINIYVCVTLWQTQWINFTENIRIRMKKKDSVFVIIFFYRSERKYKHSITMLYLSIFFYRSKCELQSITIIYLAWIISLPISVILF